MLCKDNMASLDYKSKKNNAKHIFPLIYLFFKKKDNKTPYHEMHECYGMWNANPKNKTKKNKKKSTEEWSQRVER